MARKVLVIDDDEVIRTTLRLRLGELGYEVRTVGNGEDGLAEAGRDRPDLILLDILMPGINGLEVHRRLRASGDLAEVPVIFLTAHDDGPLRQEAMSAGARFFLAKPCAPVQLLTAIDGATSPTVVRPVGGRLRRN